MVSEEVIEERKGESICTTSVSRTSGVGRSEDLARAHPKQRVAAAGDGETHRVRASASRYRGTEVTDRRADMFLLFCRRHDRTGSPQLPHAGARAATELRRLGSLLKY
jgi:hypothetical protein